MKENISQIIEEIIDDRICFRSLFNFEENRINTVDIMNICASFESQFEVTYPNFKSDTFKKIKNDVLKYLGNMKNEYNEEEESEYKNIICGLKNFNDTLRTKLEYSLEELKKVYTNKRLEFDFGKEYIDMPERFKNFRNALDHGNLEYKIINKNYHDVTLVRAIVYMMILKKANVSDENISKCLIKFSRHGV